MLLDPASKRTTASLYTVCTTSTRTMTPHTASLQESENPGIKPPFGVPTCSPAERFVETEPFFTPKLEPCCFRFRTERIGCQRRRNFVRTRPLSTEQTARHRIPPSKTPGHQLTLLATIVRLSDSYPVHSQFALRGSESGKVQFWGTFTTLWKSGFVFTYRPGWQHVGVSKAQWLYARFFQFLVGTRCDGWWYKSWLYGRSVGPGDRSSSSALPSHGYHTCTVNMDF